MIISTNNNIRLWIDDSDPQSGFQMNSSLLPEEIRSQYHSPNTSILSFQNEQMETIINFHSSGIIETFAEPKAVAILICRTAWKMFDSDKSPNKHVSFRIGRQHLTMTSPIIVLWDGTVCDEWKTILQHIQQIARMNPLK